MSQPGFCSNSLAISLRRVTLELRRNEMGRLRTALDKEMLHLPAVIASDGGSVGDRSSDCTRW